MGVGGGITERTVSMICCYVTSTTLQFHCGTESDNYPDHQQTLHQCRCQSVSGLTEICEPYGRCTCRGCCCRSRRCRAPLTGVSGPRRCWLTPPAHRPTASVPQSTCRQLTTTASLIRHRRTTKCDLEKNHVGLNLIWSLELNVVLLLF